MVDNFPLLYEGEASIQLSPGVHTLTVTKYGLKAGPVITAAKRSDT